MRPPRWYDTLVDVAIGALYGVVGVAVLWALVYAVAWLVWGRW